MKHSKATSGGRSHDMNMTHVLPFSTGSTDYDAPRASTYVKQEQQQQLHTETEHEAQQAAQRGAQHGAHLLDRRHRGALQRLLPLVQRQLGGAAGGSDGAAAASTAAAAIALQCHRQSGAYGKMLAAEETKQGFAPVPSAGAATAPPAGPRHRSPRRPPPPPTCSLATAASKPGGSATRVRSKALLLSCCTVHLRKSAILLWRSTMLMRPAPDDETSD